jgi:hypothetical protein
LVVALAVWLGWSLGKQSTVPDGGTVPADDRVSAATAAEVCGLPGLNGLWWFDESPWLTPFVRQAIAEYLAQEPWPVDLPFTAEPGNSPALSANVEAVQDWLLGVARSSQGRLTASELALLDELVRVSQDDLTDELLVLRLQAALDRFVAEVGPDESDSLWSAADLHTRAVLLHKIAALSSDHRSAEEAATSYAAAIAAYESLGTDAAPLQARCLVDAGGLFARVLKDYRQAKRRFRDARGLPGAPKLLQVERGSARPSPVPSRIPTRQRSTLRPALP